MVSAHDPKTKKPEDQPQDQGTNKMEALLEMQKKHEQEEQENIESIMNLALKERKKFIDDVTAFNQSME